MVHDPLPIVYRNPLGNPYQNVTIRKLGYAIERDIISASPCVLVKSIAKENRRDRVKILNHVDSSITAVYDRHSYDAEKCHALEAWSNKLVEVVQGVSLAPNVINF